MNLLEIKITHCHNDFVVYHSFRTVEDRPDDAAAYAAEIIENVTQSELDEMDRSDILDFAISGHLASRFGKDWEYFVEAILVSMDECDIDEEFDSVHDKYSKML